MHLFWLILCFSIMIVAPVHGKDVNFVVTIYDGDDTSACSNADFTSLETTIKDSIAFWANDYLTTIGGEEDFVITTFEPEDTTRKLVNYDDEQNHQEIAPNEEIKGSNMNRELAVVKYNWGGRGTCRLCAPDGGDSRVRNLRGLVSAFRAKKMVERINKKLTLDVRQYIRKSARNKACFKAALAFSVILELL
jgi:hypothetical protein